MSGIQTTGAAALPPALAPPQFVARQTEPRAVEETAGGSLGPDSRQLTFNSSRAVLILLERSAEQFRAVAELLKDIPSAAALSGTPVAPQTDAGAQIDEYA